MPKIVYFLSHPIQYFSPLLKAMSGISDLKVVYYSNRGLEKSFDKGFGRDVQWDVPLLEGYHADFLHNYSRSRSADNKLLDAINPGVFSYLFKSDAEIVFLNGWSYVSDWFVLFAAKLLGKKLWLRVEMPLNQESASSLKGRFKRFFLKNFLFKFFISRFLYIGYQNRLYYLSHGVDPEKLVFTPYSVDNEFFQKRASEIGDIPALREQLQLPKDKKIVAFVGKYISKKRPLDLLRAALLTKRTDLYFVFVGEGELRSEMENFIKEHALTNILLTGFINQSQIPLYYKASDCFVMCSGLGETWGLAVNEAMNFSKPVIVSHTCGSSWDLVKDGVNGFAFPEGDIEALTESIEKVLVDASTYQRMGEASRAIIESYSIDCCITNIGKALHA